MHYFYLSPPKPDTTLQEISELESSIPLECTLESLSRIMDLYKIAIENFAGHQDPRANEYQQRMKSLLSSPAVKNALSGKSSSKANRNSTEIPKNLSTERIVLKAIDRHNSETQFATEIVQNDLKLQNETLNRKIIQRRRASRGFDMFESEVEKIVEKYAYIKEEYMKNGSCDKASMEEMEMQKRSEILKVRRKTLNM